MKLRRFGLMLIFSVTAISLVHAHEVLHSITKGSAVIVRLTYVDSAPFAFESYELFRPGESVPVQVGRTDHLGRISFIPDRSGAWRIRAFSEDGHGAEFSVDTDAESLEVLAQSRSLGQHEKILIGVGCILGIFGIVSLSCRRRRT